MKSTLLSPVTISGVVPAASTCAPVMPTSSENFKSVSASQLVDNSAAAVEVAAGGTATEAAAANQSEQVNPTMTATPTQVQIADSALEDNHHGRAEIVVAKKPIDRLIEAVRMQDHSSCKNFFYISNYLTYYLKYYQVRASSPAMLYDSANFICTVSLNNLVPHWEIDEFQDWDFFSEQGGSSTGNEMKRILESTWGRVESNAEQGAKRQRTTVLA